MTANIQDFSGELLETTTACIKISKEYLENRKKHAHYYNKLIVLLKKAGIYGTKKSIDNKLLDLLADKTYGEVAEEYYLKMLESEQEYKGLELVAKAYSLHATGLMSVQKHMQAGELNENLKNKYSGFGSL